MDAHRGYSDDTDSRWYPEGDYERRRGAADHRVPDARYPDREQDYGGGDWADQPSRVADPLGSVSAAPRYVEPVSPASEPAYPVSPAAEPAYTDHGYAQPATPVSGSGYAQPSTPVSGSGFGQQATPVSGSGYAQPASPVSGPGYEAAGLSYPASGESRYTPDPGYNPDQSEYPAAGESYTPEPRYVPEAAPTGRRHAESIPLAARSTAGAQASAPPYASTPASAPPQTASPFAPAAGPDPASPFAPASGSGPASAPPFAAGSGSATAGGHAPVPPAGAIDPPTSRMQTMPAAEGHQTEAVDRPQQSRRAPQPPSDLGDGVYRSRRPAVAIGLTVMAMLFAVPPLVLVWRTAFAKPPSASAIIAGTLLVAALPLFTAGLYGLMSGAGRAVEHLGARALLRPPLGYLTVGVALLACAAIAAS